MAEKYECQLCFENKDPSSQFPMGCGHHYCWKCVGKYLEAMIDVEVIPLKCPENGCKELIDEKQIEIVVDSDMFDKYLAMKTQKNKTNEDNVRAVRQCGPPVK